MAKQILIDDGQQPGLYGNSDDDFEFSNFTAGMRSAINTNKLSLIDMMKQRIISNDKFFSIEFSPPKSTRGLKDLISSFNNVKSGGALFCAITWHASSNPAGISCNSSMNIARFASNYCGLETMLHISGYSLTKEMASVYASQALSNGIRSILAVRGDVPANSEEDAVPCCFPHAVDLVQHLRVTYSADMTIAVAGYPAGHPEATSYQEDLKYLKMKVDAGANMILTQIIFEYEVFTRFVTDCRNIGILVPIIPGILPIQNYTTFQKLVQICNLKVPISVTTMLEKLKGKDDAVRSYGIHTAFELCQKILQSDAAPGIHIFSLNREHGPVELCKRLNLWVCEPEHPVFFKTDGERKVSEK